MKRIWEGTAFFISSSGYTATSRNPHQPRRPPQPELLWAENVVQHFEIGDSVLILPRYARLYASESGVIVAVIPDPFRRAFNEYTVEFPDGSTATVFEFQIREVPK